MSVKVGIKRTAIYIHKNARKTSLHNSQQYPIPIRTFLWQGVLSKILTCDNIMVFIKLSVPTIKSALGLEIKLFVYCCAYVIVTYFIYSLVSNKFKISHHCQGATVAEW